MQRPLIILAVAVALVIAMSLPASAQTWIQLRYWSTNGQWFNGGFQPTYTSNPIGLGVRRNFAGGVWGLSFNYDRGGVANYSAGSLGNDAFNTFWSVNLHRNLTLTNGMASVYLGFGGIAFEGPTGGVFLPFYVRQTGVRVGVDAMVRFGPEGKWYALADAAFMPGQSATQNNFSVIGMQSETASSVDWRGGVGVFVRPNVALEAGYRGLTWTFTPTPMCAGATPCNFRWSGWYGALNFALP